MNKKIIIITSTPKSSNLYPTKFKEYFDRLNIIKKRDDIINDIINEKTKD